MEPKGTREAPLSSPLYDERLTPQVFWQKENFSPVTGRKKNSFSPRDMQIFLNTIIIAKKIKHIAHPRTLHTSALPETPSSAKHTAEHCYTFALPEAKGSAKAHISTLCTSALTEDIGSAKARQHTLCFGPTRIYRQRKSIKQHPVYFCPTRS